MNLAELRASEAVVLTVAQVSELLTDLEGKHVDKRTIRLAIDNGQLPCIRLGRRMLIPKELLLDLLVKRSEPTSRKTLHGTYR